MTDKLPVPEGELSMGQGTNYEKYFLKELQIPSQPQPRFPQIKSQAKVKTIYQRHMVVGSDRELIDEVHDLDRQEEFIEPPEMLTDAEQYVQLIGTKGGMVSQSMAPTTVALIRKAIKESGSRTGQAIWTYVKPQSVPFGGTVKYTDGSSPKNLLRSSSPQIFSHHQTQPVNQSLASRFPKKAESPQYWDEGSVNILNQSPYDEGLHCSGTPAIGKRLGSPYKMSKKKSQKPPKGVQTQSKAAVQLQLNRYVTPLSTIPRHVMKIKDEDVRQSRKEGGNSPQSLFDRVSIDDAMLQQLNTFSTYQLQSSGSPKPFNDRKGGFPQRSNLSPLGLSYNQSPKQSILLPHAQSITTSADIPPNFIPYAKGFMPIMSSAHNSNMDVSTYIYGQSNTTTRNPLVSQSGPSLMTSVIRSLSKNQNQYSPQKAKINFPPAGNMVSQSPMSLKVEKTLVKGHHQHSVSQLKPNIKTLHSGGQHQLAPPVRVPLPTIDGGGNLYLKPLANSSALSGESPRFESSSRNINQQNSQELILKSSSSKTPFGGAKKIRLVSLQASHDSLPKTSQRVQLNYSNDTPSKSKDTMGGDSIQTDIQRMEDAENLKIQTMKQKTEEMKQSQVRQAYRNMNLERMRLILMFAYQNKLTRPTSDIDQKQFSNSMLTRIAQRHQELGSPPVPESVQLKIHLH